MLKIKLLGPLAAEIDGRPLHFETRKVAALLAYLILHPGENRREKLAALLWPDFDPVHAMANLRRALGSLNHMLPPGCVAADRETICWNALTPVRVDVRDYQLGLHAAREAAGSTNLENLEALVALYRADFLQDLALPDCPEFDEWQYGFREELLREYAWVLERLAASWSARSEWEKAAEVARRWVRLDRLDANAQLALTDIYTRSGQHSLARRTYEEYSRLIQNEFHQELEEAVKDQFQNVLSQSLPKTKETKSGPSERRAEVNSSQGFEALLKTKLYIPRLKPGRVRRQRLLAMFEDAAQYKLILVSAPAGFGKTTLLAEWAAATQDPVGWISLDREDNDPGRFLRYLCAALDSLFDGIAEPVRELLQSPSPINLKPVVSILLNEVGKIGENMYLVLDDYQFVTAEAVHELVTCLLERAAPNLHLVIATRADPALPLARLRVQGDLLEIRTDDLRFTIQETEALLDQVSGVALEQGDLHAVFDRTEGWAVGLQMAALALQGPTVRSAADRARFVRNFSGTHRYILDYLIQEVLVQQSLHVQDFLLKTSILDRLCGDLCEAVIGEPAEPGFQTLDYLERCNLFLVPLDEEAAGGTGAGWFRYHHLFADLLASQLHHLQPRIIPELHARASAWFEKNGWIDRAIEHALLSEDFIRAGNLVEKSAQKLVYQIPFATIQNWINRLPDTLVQQRAWIGITQGWLWIAIGRSNSLESWIDRIEKNFLNTGVEQYPESEQQDIRANCASLRAYDAFFKGDLLRSADLSNQALQLMSPANEDLRLRVLVQSGETHLLLQDLERAIPYLYQAIEAAVGVGDFQSATTAVMRLYKALKIRGKLNEAEKVIGRVFQALVDAGRGSSPVVTKLEQCLGDLLRERGRLAEAGIQIELGLKHARQYNTPLDIITALIYKSSWLMSLGNLDKAENVIEEAEPLFHSFTIPPVVLANWGLQRARTWLEKGDFERVEQWLRDSQLIRVDAPNNTSEEVRIFYARVLLRKGKPEEASKRLDEIIQNAEAGGRTGSLLQALIIQACAWDALNQEDKALETLLECLRLAHAEKYIMPFLDEGEPVCRLLKALLRQAPSGSLPEPLADDALRLIRAFE